jgi:hypothetical protein
MVTRARAPELEEAIDLLDGPVDAGVRRPAEIDGTVLRVAAEAELSGAGVEAQEPERAVVVAVATPSRAAGRLSWWVWAARRSLFLPQRKVGST